MSDYANEYEITEIIDRLKTENALLKAEVRAWREWWMHHFGEYVEDRQCPRMVASAYAATDAANITLAVGEGKQ